MLIPSALRLDLAFVFDLTGVRALAVALVPLHGACTVAGALELRIRRGALLRSRYRDDPIMA